MKRTRVVPLILVALIAGATLGTFSLDRVFATASQVRNLERGRAIARDLDEYNEKRRRYPDRLELAVSGDHIIDEWGEPFLYLTNGKAYILVSFGRRGKPDRDLQDYWRSRSSTLTTQSASAAVWSICGSPSEDQIMSDLGEHRICGK